ncbi:MAG: ATP-binding protein [Sideroxyarcus sp.]|nr:ATP-binding protein [Sideroxyarcus sp.]
MSSDGTSSFPASAASSTVFIRRMVWGVVSINLFVFGMVVFSLQQSYGEYEERGEITAQNLSQMLAQDIGREFEKIDVTLYSAVDEIEHQLARGGIDRKMLNTFLERVQKRVPEIISMRTTDAAGIVRYGQGVDPGGRLNNSDREYFFLHRDNPGAGVVISKPVFARIDKRWVIPISRAFRLPDGSFGGVVYSNVALEHLAKVFSSIGVGRRGSVSLRDAELTIYARFPVPEDGAKVIGHKLDVPELQALVQSGSDAGTYVSSHTVDGVERKFAVRRIDNLRLYAVVGTATDEFMAPWRAQAAKVLMLETLFFLTTLISSWLIYRGWKLQMAATLELARNEEKFHTVADYTYDWEYWEGAGREMLYMSPACEHVTGYSLQEFMATPELLARITHPDDVHLLENHRHDVADVKEAELDFRIVRKDGGIRWIAHVCQPVFGRDGQFMGRRISNRDITERKQAEDALSTLNTELGRRVAQRTAELETAIYDLENFNYSASHDLRIPLRAIDGFSWILIDEHSHQLDADGKRLLKVIRDNTRKMSLLIDDMQAFSRTGRMPMVLAEIDMQELVREVIAEFKTEAVGRDIEWKINSMPPAIADRAMLRRVLSNLLGNAIKFTRTRASARIEVGAVSSNQEIAYFVKDNGVGFDMKYADMLFGVFRRLHAVEEFEGAGIGLAIVKRIIVKHGGRVWAEGKVDEGATIYFALPHTDRPGA